MNFMDDTQMSKRHAVIFFCDGSFYLMDRGSKRGTWIEKKEIKGIVGMEIKLGNKQDVRFTKIEVRVN
jgi:hypothetical protein